MIVAVAAGVLIAVVTASIPGEDVKGAVTRVDFAPKPLTVLGLLVGLTWALLKLVVSPAGLVDEIGETTYSNLKLDLTCEVVAYRHDMRIVTFVVTLENVGKVPIRSGRPGCQLSVYEVPDDLPEGATVAAGDGEALVDAHDLLAKYDSTPPCDRTRRDLPRVTQHRISRKPSRQCESNVLLRQHR